MAVLLAVGLGIALGCGIAAVAMCFYLQTETFRLHAEIDELRWDSSRSVRTESAN